MRQGTLALGLAAVLLFAGCRRGNDQGAGTGACPLPALEEKTEIAGMGAVRYCALQQVRAQVSRVQFLMDGSGSMKGFSAYLPQVSEWAAQSFSQLRNSGMEFREARNCYFSLGRGIYGCSSARLPVSGAAGGDTNLHEAIRSAAGYDLSLIVTDGVAATGTGTGDCAGGVDAACIGRALSDQLAPRPGAPQNVPAGLWLVPMAALFNGPLYTEQFAHQDFRPDASAGNVARDTATHAALGEPGKDRNGKLVFDYKGPRGLLALVLSHDAEVGRAFVAALAGRAAPNTIQTLESLKQFQTGLAVMAPIEVFPGYLPPVHWGQPRVVVEDGVERICGTLDLAQTSTGSVRMNCPGQGDSAWVEVPALPDSRSSACVNLQVLPKLNIARRSSSGFSNVQGARWDGSIAAGGSPRLVLALSCDRNWQAPCGANEPGVEWVGRTQFPASADRISSQDASVPAVASIAALSTNEVAAMPHRIFGLSDTLEKLYRELGGRNVEVPFARLTFCR